MKFMKTEEQQMAVDGLRKFLDHEIEPIVSEYRDKFIPRDKMQAIQKSIFRLSRADCD